MKQTAIDFLIDNFHYYYSTKWNDILKQAKEMEKQQIIDFAEWLLKFDNLKNENKYIIEQLLEMYKNENKKNI